MLPWESSLFRVSVWSPRLAIAFLPPFIIQAVSMLGIPGG